MRDDDRNAHRLKIALFGHPLGHSRSQELFAAVSGRSCPEIDYQPVEVSPAGLEAAIERMRRGEWDGANVTIPHKGEVLRYVDSLDLSARTSGAVNVIVRSGEGVLHGINTDGEGFCDALKVFSQGPPDLEQAGVVIFGTGGAARGVGAAVRQRGAEVTFVTRRPGQSPSEVMSLAREIIGWDSRRLSSCIEEALLVVQATSLGMAPSTEEAVPAPRESFRKGQYVVDLIYNPPETRFMQQVRRQGADVINGWPMLVHQAARALDHWAGSGAGKALIEHWL